MRIFLLILSLIAAAACVFLNVLGYNGTLSQIEYILITAAVEILLCLLLGHFAYRTYANHKRAKKLSQTLTNAQAALQVQESEETPSKTRRAAHEETPAKEQAPTAAKRTQHTPDQSTSETTRPLTPNTASATDPDATTLYQTPFKD